MKSVLIVCFVDYEGPGYLTEYLDAKHITWQFVAIDHQEALPETATDYSGMVFMGGPMSANDELPWIAPVIALIQQAHTKNIPLLGHCLGGQLITKALGGKVTKMPMKEIGWGQVSVANNAAAKTWFGAVETFNAFHWHGETFDLPTGATHLLSSQFCQNQAYALGPHLVLQTHVEVQPAMVERWCEEGAEELAASESPAVQSAKGMQTDLLAHCTALHQVARQLYGQWVKNLRR